MKVSELQFTGKCHFRLDSFSFSAVVVVAVVAVAAAAVVVVVVVIEAYYSALFFTVQLPG